MLSGLCTNARSFMRPRHAGHRSTVNPKVVLLRDLGMPNCLRHEGLWAPPPEPAAARAPPYQRSVTRLHPSRQAELSFDT